MHNSERLTRGRPRHQLLMNPGDLPQRAIEDGSRVRVTSRVGSVEVEVAASDDLMPGVVSLPHGYGHAGDGVLMSRSREVPGVSDQRPHRPRAARRVGQRRAQRRTRRRHRRLSDVAQELTSPRTASTSSGVCAASRAAMLASSVNAPASACSTVRWSSPAPAMPTTYFAGLPFQSIGSS